MTQAGDGHQRTRSDIQALRGYAVLLVILYHTELGFMPFGFIGVDVFFVISGYLITGIITRSLRRGTFDFQSFYVRRIRRLFPATFVTLLVTLTGSTLLLTSSAWQNFESQLYGALAFATNVVLWRQINYFKTEADLEPLLHMWSLAVEEQYYLVLPVVLRIVPQRFWITAIALVTVSSLGAYAWLYPHSPGAAFYLLPTRAWEIGIGAIVSFLPPPTGRVPSRRATAIVATLLLLILPIVPITLQTHLLALPAALATAALLYVDIPQRGLNWLERPLGWFGDRSYSLYLLHWPIFALTRNVYVGQPLPFWLTLALVGLTCALAALLYRFVEKPIHHSNMPAPRVWAMLAGGTALLAGGCWLAAHRAAAARPLLDLAPVYGLELAACQSAETPFTGTCGQGNAPSMLIWGDSLSQAITPAIDASTDEQIAQASMGQCVPLLGLAPYDLDSPRPSGQRCIAHNQGVLDYAIRTPSIRVVVLTGDYLRYANTDTIALVSNGNLRKPSISVIAEAQARLTAALRDAGKRVVVIAPPPQARFDIGACWERRLEHRPTVATFADCALTRTTRRAEEVTSGRMLAAFAEAGTPVIALNRMICPDARCFTQWGGKPLYRDGKHLSRSGSIAIGQRFRLGEIEVAPVV